MKKVLAVVTIGLLMLGSYIIGQWHTTHSTASASGARRVLYWVDPMHPDFKSDHSGTAPDCGMPLEPVYAAAASPALDTQPLPAGSFLIDSEKQQMFGIRVAPVEKSDGAERLRVLGRVVAEDTRVYRVDAGMEGFVRKTFHDSVGEFVKKDQKLATTYGGDSLAVASGFLAATAGVTGSGHDGSRTVPFPGAVSKQGASSVQGYTDRLRNLGMSDTQIKEMDENRQLPESTNIVAPADGFILARNISAGMHFERTMEFYRIADLSQVWIVADILGSEAQCFRPGTQARISVQGSGKTFTARVSNALPQVDSATRTLKLRLEAENPGYALRPDMFVDVELPGSVAAGLTVPVDALIDSGRERHVFVERSTGVFEPRQVEVGWRSTDRVLILSGLVEGERVVSSGTFLVDSESRLKTAQFAPQSEQRPAVPPAVRSATVKDASCGMMIDAAKAAADGNTLTRDGITYYFCSEKCRRKFSAQADHDPAASSSGRHS